MRIRNHLALAVAAFVLLDLGTLAFSFSIARQVEKDAVAINLSGRQRMLSQRITKAALLATTPARSSAERASSADEVRQSYLIFRQTLLAFSAGGEATGGDGQPVHLDGVEGRAALLVGEVRGMLARWPQAPSDDAGLEKFAQFMVERNGEILNSMNQLTTALEQQSVAAVSRLRLAQSLAFALSLVNFVIILLGMRRTQLQAETRSVTDALTGLLNRGGFYSQLNAAIERHAISHQPLGVLLLDLNGFKAVNDNHGHAAGDATLREVARRLLDLKSKGWTCGRLGGDEFAVLCPDLAPEQLALAAQQLDRILSGIPGGDLTISASVGWAAFEPQQRADDIIAAADAMMYAIKNTKALPRSHRQRQR